MIRIVACLLFCLVMTSCASAPPESETPDYPAISIARGDKPALVIEDDGSPVRQKLYALAQQVQAMDVSIMQWQKTASGDAEVVQGMTDTMIQNREIAVAELEQGWLASSTRSWGSAAEHVESASNEIANVQTALTSKPPGSLYCRTQISAAGEGGHIHYLPEGVFRDGGEDWISSTAGSNIKIGNYRFQVSRGEQVFNEKVTILQDPFVHVIQPRQMRP